MNNKKEYVKAQITVIIPVYNVEPYLRECLDTVVNQTMRELQIICINDGSTDNSLAILEEYAGRDSRILIINKTNAGVSSARNIGLENAEGKYILFVDSDDTIDTKLCEKVYTKAEQSNADFVLFFHDTPNGHHCVCDTTISPDDKISWEEKKSLLNFGTVWGKLWQKDFIKKNNLKFYEQVIFYDDVLFYWQGLSLASKVSVLPEILYHYYLRSNALTAFHGERFLEIPDELIKSKSFLKENKLYQLYNAHFLRLEIDWLFNIYLIIDNKFKPEFCKKLKDLLGEEEKHYLRNERYIDYSVTYFYFYITRDWGIFLMFLRRRIRSFLGTSKRNVIKFFRTNILKNTDKSDTDRK